MRYRYINPEVNVQRVTEELLTQMKGTPLGETTTNVGDFLVTLDDGKTIVITEKELASRFKPASLESPGSNKKELYKLCTEILDQEALLDDFNAEELLITVFDLTRDLRGKIM